LTEAKQRHPGVPVVLVGHSMGGRTSLRVAHDPAISGLVALCPWWPENETLPPDGLPIRVAFAEWDWECPYPSMRAFIHRAREVADVRVTNLGKDTHYMFRSRRWEQFILRSVAELVPESAG
jgi:pimeloyl-ACP methyl ester carboxylesterase